MKRYRIHVLFVAFAIMQSCTNFQEEEIPISFGVNTNELTFLKGGDTRSLTVSSGSKWDVTSMPGWVSLGRISRSGISPYEWTVDFSASANDEYNRHGTIIFRAQSETKEIPVTQEGKKGKFIAVESISISPTELSLTEGENASLTYIITPSDATIKDVTWSSSNTSVATVSSSGVVTARAAGSATITVTTKDGKKTASCAVIVETKVIPVMGVSLDMNSLSMHVGDIQTLTATVTPSNATDKSVTWSSSNTSVASISSSGEVVAKAIGSTTITVTTNDGNKKASCNVNVTPISVTGVSLDKNALSLMVGEQYELIVTVEPYNASNREVRWSSDNPSVATIHPLSNASIGVVVARATGTANITVTTEEGQKSATCSVNVMANSDVVDLGLSVKWATCNLGASTPSEYGDYYAWGVVNPSSGFDPRWYPWFTFLTLEPSEDSAGIIHVRIDKYVCESERLTLYEYDNRTGYQLRADSYTIDNKEVLDLEDDAAYHSLGTGWRIPTNEEWKEIIEQCEWTLTTMNGVEGYKVSSKTLDASIFLPKAGFINVSGGPIDLNEYGDYWSSSLSSNRPFVAKSVSFGASGIFNREGWYRYCGLSIRPVHTK